MPLAKNACGLAGKVIIRTAAPVTVLLLTQSDSEEEPAMYSLDINTNTAVERQAERMSVVRRVGLAQMAGPAGQSWPMDGAPHTGLPVGQIGRALVVGGAV